jgi:hypothetical protein
VRRLRSVSITTRHGKYGIDSPLRYFTEKFLLLGSTSPNSTWHVSIGTANPPESYTGAIVKHIETGHVWVITADPGEQWADGKIFLGRWPD